jgi:hypothetical protein
MTTGKLLTELLSHGSCALHTVSWWQTFVPSYFKFSHLKREWSEQAVVGHFFHIWPWCVTLTSDPVIQFMRIVLCLMAIHMHTKVQVILSEWLSYTPKKPAACKFTFDLTMRFVSQCQLAIFVQSYFKFANLKTELIIWIGCLCPFFFKIELESVTFTFDLANDSCTLHFAK